MHGRVGALGELAARGADLGLRDLRGGYTGGLRREGITVALRVGVGGCGWCVCVWGGGGKGALHGGGHRCTFFIKEKGRSLVWCRKQQGVADP